MKRPRVMSREIPTADPQKGSKIKRCRLRDTSSSASSVDPLRWLLKMTTLRDAASGHVEVGDVGRRYSAGTVGQELGSLDTPL